MLYFKKNGDLIEKYQVSFDGKEIERLKIEIINNCSFIKHKEYKSDYSPRFTDESLIRNLQSTYVGEKEYFEETRDVYLYSYDEYIPPYLVELINRLLEHDSKAIDEIFNYDISTKTSIDDRINSVNQELIKTNPEDITQKKAKLKELEDLLKAKELNKGQQSIDLYYNQLMGLIKFDLVDSLSISELSRIESFLEIKLANNIIASDSEDKAFEKSLKKR